MAYAGHQDAFTFQRDPEHNDAATSPVCSMLDALMHPVPLSVLALSVLVAMGFGPQLYYKASRRLLQIPVSDLQDETPPKALNEFSPKKLEQPQAQQAGKKKRAKERQKRAKEPLKEIPAKLTKSGKSSSFAQLPRKNEYQTRHQPPLHRSRTAVHNTFADESTFSGSSAAGDDDGHVDPSSTLPSTPTADEPHQTPTQKNLPISVPSFPKLSPPLPASSLTVSLLSRFAESPSSLQFAPAGPSAESPIVPSPDHDSRTLTSSPTSPSVLSGIASTTPSSLLSPQTPPVLPLPTFQSLPTNISESDELLFQDLNSHIAPDTDNLWIEGNSRAQPRYGHEAVQGTKIATSVSAPVWDSSLDWDNESNKRGSDSTLRGQSVNSSSVETLVLPEIADSPYSVSPPGEQFSFPSLNDPPPTPSNLDLSAPHDSVPEGLDVGALRAALEESKANEERWRLGCVRRGEEIERLKWAWTEEVRKWSRREMEMQQQIYRFISMQTVQLQQQQYGVPSPVSGTFPLVMPNGSGKPGVPFSPTGSLPVSPQIHAPHPQFAIPGSLGFPPFSIINGIPVGPNPLGSPTGIPSRPNSTAPGNRRGSSNFHKRPSASSRHSSRSRASSPFSPVGPNPNAQASSSQIKSSPGKPKMQPSNSLGSSSSQINGFPPLHGSNSVPRSIASPSSRSSSVLGGYDVESGTPIDLAIAESDEGAEEEDAIPEHLASAILKNPGGKAGSVESSASRSSTASSPRKTLQPLQTIFSDSPPSGPTPVAVMEGVVVRGDGVDGVDHSDSRSVSPASLDRDQRTRFLACIP